MRPVSASYLNTPYVASEGDFVEFDNSGGPQVSLTCRMPPTPGPGWQVTVVWSKWAAGSPPPVVDFNGHVGTPFLPDVQTSGATVSTTAITVQGAAQSWIFDGTQWVNAS